MTERERFIKTLKREPVPGRVPHFELVFFLTMESFGKIHPSQRKYGQWDQMSASEKKAHINDIADTHIMAAEKYHHSAIFIHANPGDHDNFVRLAEAIREKSGDKYFLLTDNDPTFSIPGGDNMTDFSVRMYEDPEGVKGEAGIRLVYCLNRAEKLAKHKGLLDGFAMCSDYCFNVNPFFSPEQFGEFVTPYLCEAVKSYREMGFYTIKHTDGNIMPIIDQMVECRPDALHSIDPQAGVSLKKIKRLYGDKVAICGNVNCGLLQTGSEEECTADIRRSIRDGMEGGAGYIFCTSNCAYTGLPLERYELMHDIWYEEAVY
ncbi:MAG: hypothetical protein FWF08_04130 [Oscillospiraceae bacterium]|nr:hypothetical protein [Oscillospiraceae bacterium]